MENNQNDNKNVEDDNLNKENTKENENEGLKDNKAGEGDDDEEENITIIRNLDENSEYQRSIKVIVLGDSSVGKSTLINRIKQKDIHNISATLSLEYHTYIMSLHDYKIRMQIWDTAGQEKFNSIVSNYYKGTEVAIFVYSIESEQTFKNVVMWYKNLKENSSEKSLDILIGNKKDLEKENRKVTNEQGEKFAVDNNFFLFREISCKSNDKEEFVNIIEIFDEIGKYFYKYDKSRSIPSEDLDYKASESMIAIGEKQRKNPEKKGCCGK